jgi:hypothetical protein
MASRTEGERKTSSSKKKSSGGRSSASGSSAQVLKNVVVGAVGSDALLDLIERLGLVDLIVGRIKARIEDTDIDELIEDLTDYLRRNPEVLVATLGAVTITTGLLVWLNARREWDGSERRTRSSVSSAPGRVKRTTRASATDDDEDDEL